jgi:hypothetical protein
MFVNIMQFPLIKEGKDAAFREWFAWSNEQYAKHKGFIRRRLLEPRKDGNYVALVEHESFETFMSSTPAQPRLRPWSG